MTTSPSQSFTVVVVARADDEPAQLATTVIPIPPDYDAGDLEQFYGFVVERTAGRMLRDAGWNRPRFRALMINAARLWLIEQRLNSAPEGRLRNALLEIILRDDDEVLAEADLPPED